MDSVACNFCPRYLILALLERKKKDLIIPHVAFSLPLYLFLGPYLIKISYFLFS